MFVAVFASVVLMFGTVASVLEMAPDTDALKSRGHAKRLCTWKKNIPHPKYVVTRFVIL